MVKNLSVLWNCVDISFLLKCNFFQLFCVSIGRYDFSLPLLRCDSCHCQWTPGIKDLISNGYWPGTVDFHTVFAIDVFLTFEDLKISAPGLSRHAFIKMLESRSVRAGRVMHMDMFQKMYTRHDKQFKE